MSSNTNNLEILRSILEKSHQPQLLDSHPWTRSLFVLQANSESDESGGKRPGQRLVHAITKIFIQMMPATPPRHGKRMDTHWGEFGMLAAMYFGPILYGEPVPSSLREAWGRIDQNILLFAYGKPGEALSDEEKVRYKLVGNESSIAPNSTLSDWHRKGLEHLTEAILRRESYLSGTRPELDSFPRVGQSKYIPIQRSKPRKVGGGRLAFLFLGILLLGLVLYDGIRIWQINRQVRLVRQDVAEMRALISAPDSILDRVKSAGPALSTLRQDFKVLQSETESFFLTGTLFGWLPIYGGDLSSGQTLVNIADNLLGSADTSYRAIAPLLEETSSSGLTPTRLTEVLVAVQPQLIEAELQINQARTARTHLEVNRLTPGVRDLVLNELDPLINSIGDGLRIAEDFPRLMGATSEGPKSYLLLVQNEDELRPTGGFITAVGTLLLDNGRISNMTFVNSYDLDNWTKPYPTAPWQLQQYMDTSVLVLRDANWFTDFPTAALYAETLYSYADGHTVDGAIAFDQQFLVDILDAVGPITVEGAATPIDSGNVIAYMRAAKTPTTEELASNIYITKPIFLNKIAIALVGKLFSGDIPAERLFNVLLKALNERNLLLKFDGPTITSILARERWDGAVRPEAGDFLMVVDTNVGFNKTNAMVQTSLVYDVDLTKLVSPTSSLSVVHTNNAAPVICAQSIRNKKNPPGEEQYLLTDCYWNYMRVYMPGGTKLIDAVPQFVPANWMIIKQDVAAKVDTLDEKIDGVQAFGTLQVVPGGESQSTSFQFALPPTIIQAANGQSLYHLLIQKQPGTKEIPITVRVHLPNNVLIKEATPGAAIQSPNILYQTVLQTDIRLDIGFQTP